MNSLPNSTTFDPLLPSGEHTLTDFCRRAIKSGPSKTALSSISKIELLKDTRVSEHWMHEYLVFTVIKSEDRNAQGDSGIESDVLVLYLERGLEDEEDSLMDFARRGFTGNAADTLSFYEAGGDDDRERRGWSTSVFEITLKPAPSLGPFKLRHLAQLLASESYVEKYPLYGLFSANCWSWSRGLFFDIIRHPRVAVKEALAFKDGSVSALRKGDEIFREDEIVMEKEELELFIITQYGAYGRALLHFTSDDFRARYPSFLLQYFVRLIILSYSIVGLVTDLKRILRHSTNWTVCIREILVGPEQTTNRNGWDITSTYHPPNFVKLIPWTQAFVDRRVPDGLCEPGQYLYLLTSPIDAPLGLSSIHIFVFGRVHLPSKEGQAAATDIRKGITGTSEGGETDRSSSTEDLDLANTWLSCKIIRPSTNKKYVQEMGDTYELGIIPGCVRESNLHYSAICRLDRSHPLTKVIKHGDVLGLWAHTHGRITHVPRIASVKVVARRPIGILDVLLAVYLTWETHQFMQVGPSLQALQRSTMCVPYVLSTWFEGWVWNNLAIFARTLHKQLYGKQER